MRVDHRQVEPRGARGGVGDRPLRRLRLLSVGVGGNPRAAVGRGARGVRGLTLVELLMAIAGTAVVAVAVAMMLDATTYGTDSSRDMRALVVKEKALTGRINAAVRSGRAVLAQGEGYLVLWLYDETGDGLPSVSELRYLVRRADTGELWSYKTVWPDSMTDEQVAAANASYELTENFQAVAEVLTAQPYFPGEVWAQGVTSWGLTLDHDEPQQARLVSYRMTCEAGTIDNSFIGAVALRNAVTP